jgi:hypothetical protein
MARWFRHPRGRRLRACHRTLGGMGPIVAPPSVARLLALETFRTMPPRANRHRRQSVLPVTAADRGAAAPSRRRLRPQVERQLRLTQSQEQTRSLPTRRCSVAGTAKGPEYKHQKIAPTLLAVTIYGRRNGVTRSTETDRSIAGFMVSVTTSGMRSCLVNAAALRRLLGAYAKAQATSSMPTRPSPHSGNTSRE